jgi:hypothetical protein
MTNTPSSALRAARIARGFASAAEAARYFGWNDVTYAAHENGGRGIRPNAAKRYAKAFGVDPSVLLGLTAENTYVNLDADDGVPIVGTAAWGVWRDSFMLDSGVPKSISIPRNASRIARAAVIVGDESVNKTLQQGDVAIYEPTNGFNAIVPGKLIVIKRTNGTLVEMSIRRVISNVDGQLKLTDHSHNSKFREVIDVPVGGSGDVEILGLVVARYAPV